MQTANESESSRRVRARREFAMKFICPDCGCDLAYVPAKYMHKAHSEVDMARSCTNQECGYICFMGDSSRFDV